MLIALTEKLSFRENGSETRKHIIKSDVAYNYDESNKNAAEVTYWEWSVDF